MDVGIGGARSGVAEPKSDHRGVHAGLGQCHGAGVAEHVRMDPFACQRWALSCCGGRVCADPEGVWGAGMGRPDFPRSILESQARFGDEAACPAYLFQCRWPAGFVCPRCQGQKAWSRVARAEHEKHLTWRTRSLRSEERANRRSYGRKRHSSSLARNDESAFDMLLASRSKVDPPCGSSYPGRESETILVHIGRR